MGDAYRGLTIRIGADAQPLTRALSSIRSAARATSTEVGKINKALRQDPGNTKLIGLQIRSLGDQSKIAATQIAFLQRSIKETLSGYKGGKGNLSTMLKDAEANAANARRQFNSLDAALEECYDTIKKYNVAVKGMSDKEATSALRKLQTEARNSKDEVAMLERELRRVWSTDKSLIPFDTKNIDEAIAKWKELRVQHQTTQRELEHYNKFVGLKNQVVDLELAQSHLKQVRIEAINARNALEQLGSSKGARNAASQQRLLSESTKEAENSLRSMMGVSKALPNSFNAAVAQARSFEQVTRLLQQQIQLVGARLKSLDSSKVAKIESDFITTGNAVRVLTDRAAGLEREFESVSAEVMVLEERMKGLAVGSAAFQKCENEVKELNSKLGVTESKLTKVHARLREANSAHAFRTAEAELASLNGQLATHEAMLASANKKWGQFGANLRTAGYSMMATLGATAMIGGMYAIQAATDIDSAYRNMRKTVNGTEEQFVHLKDAALSFSQTHFTSADQILEIEAIGGQLGIQVQNLERFAETVSNIDIATNLDTETISQNLGQLSNIMNDMDQSIQSGPGSMSAYGDALVRLGNNSAAQEDKIQNVMMRIASMGTICNMTTPDLLALSTATAATGQGAEAAGTALSKTFSGIESAVNGSERALSKLQNSSNLTEDEIADLTAELEKGQVKLELFAEVAGMSADEFKAAWNGDNVMRDAFLPFIQGLKRIDDEGGSVDSTLKELGITSVRQKQTLQGLTQTVGILGNSLTMSNDAWNGVSDQWGAAGDAAREAQRKSEGFSGQLEMLKNNAKVLASVFLESLTPALAGTVDMLRGIVDGFKGLPDGVKQATVGAAALAALSGPMMIFGGTVLSAGSSMKDFFTGQKQGWTLTKTAIEGGGDALQFASTMLDKNGNVLKKSGSLAERFGTRLFDAGSKVKDFGSKASFASGPITKLGGAMEKTGLSAFSLAGKMPAILAVTALVGGTIWAVTSALEAMKQREELLAKATETMSDRMSGAFDNIATKSKSVFEGNASDAITHYNSFLQSAAARNEELGKSLDTLTGNLAKMQNYSSDITELMQKLEATGNLNANEFQMLSTAVAEYNQITGESIQVTKNEDGTISVLKDNVKLAADAFADLAKQKELAAKADYFQKEYNAAYETNMDAQIGKAKTDSALKASQDRLKALEADSSPKTYEDLTNWQNEINAVKAEIDGLTGELQTYDGVLSDTNKTMEQASKITELFNSAEVKQQGTLENIIASNSAFTAAYQQSAGTLSQFKDVCDKAGVSTEQLAKVDLAQIFSGWDGSMSDLVEELVRFNLISSDTAKSLEDLNLITIDDKNYFVDDDGSIQWQEGQLQDLQDIVIDGKHYYVTDDGSVYDEQGKCENFELFTINDKHYMVTSDGTVLYENDECERLESFIINGKHYAVDNDGTVYDQQGQLQQLENFQFQEKTLFVSSEGIITAEGELYTFDQLGIDPKDYIVDDGNTVRIAEDKLDSLKQKMESVPPEVPIKVNVDAEEANSLLDGIKDKLASLVDKTVTVTTVNKTVGQNAAGGILSMANQKNVALHAAGAFITNGTTYIGTDKRGVRHVAGEAGREFVQHHADGTTSIIPVQNKKYMAPFVSAVADMLAGNEYNMVSRDDLYKVAEAVIRSNKQGDIVLVLDDREIARAVRKYAA